MNDTAKKLREAAEPMRGSGIAAAYAIRLVQKMLDTESTPTFSGNLAAALDVIADELDELQAKADRRRKHIGHLESTIAERNRELRELRGQVPTDREKQILAMWPRFEMSLPSMCLYCKFGWLGFDSTGKQTVCCMNAANLPKTPKTIRGEKVSPDAMAVLMMPLNGKCGHFRPIRLGSKKAALLDALGLFDGEGDDGEH